MIYRHYSAAIAWILNIQYFIVQFVISLTWTTPFSLSHNTISDLGNTVCGNYDGRYVCSPYHLWMNSSFVLLGVTVLIGAILLLKNYYQTTVARLALALLAIDGLGTMLVGVSPENSQSPYHVIGAGLAFVLGNIAIILLGFTHETPRLLRYMGIAGGSIALAALAVFVSKIDTGLGMGGIERIVAYPQTLWMIALGLYLLYYRKLERTS